MKVFFFLAQVFFSEYQKIQVAAVGEIFNGNCELGELIVLRENTARAFRQ